MIRLKQYMRLKISNRLAATAAILLLVSSITGPTDLMQAEETAALALQSEDSNLDQAVAGLASAVGQTTSKAINISLLIFRF